jgi:hypothetical protein
MIDTFRYVFLLGFGGFPLLIALELLTFFSAAGSMLRCWRMGRKRAAVAMICLALYFLLQSIDSSVWVVNGTQGGVKLLDAIGCIGSLYLSLYVSDERTAAVH